VFEENVRGKCLDGECLDGECLDGECLDGECLDGEEARSCISWQLQV
jgi:hypothetical protein